jgi:Helix-turn-helix domain
MNSPKRNLTDKVSLPREFALTGSMTQPIEEIEYMNSINADNYFAIIPEWVLQANISATAIRLYCVLRRRADKNSFQCHPNRKTLAKDLQVGSVSTVDRAMKELESIGAVKIAHRKNGEEYTSNLYTVITANPIQKWGEVASNLGLGSLTNDEQTIVIKPESSNHIKNSREKIQSIIDLCFYLADAIEKRGLRPRPTDEQINSDRWYSEMRLLTMGKIGAGDTREDSGAITSDQIRIAIDWAMNDSFWATNILSPAKLRIQYPTMRIRATAQKEKRAPKGLATLIQMRSEENRKSISQ